MATTQGNNAFFGPRALPAHMRSLVTTASAIATDLRCVAYQGNMFVVQFLSGAGHRFVGIRKVRGVLRYSLVQNGDVGTWEAMPPSQMDWVTLREYCEIFCPEVLPSAVKYFKSLKSKRITEDAIKASFDRLVVEFKARLIGGGGDHTSLLHFVSYTTRVGFAATREKLDIVFIQSGRQHNNVDYAISVRERSREEREAIQRKLARSKADAVNKHLAAKLRQRLQFKRRTIPEVETQSGFVKPLLCGAGLLVAHKVVGKIAGAISNVKRGANKISALVKDIVEQFKGVAGFIKFLKKHTVLCVLGLLFGLMTIIRLTRFMFDAVCAAIKYVCGFIVPVKPFEPVFETQAGPLQVDSDLFVKVFSAVFAYLSGIFTGTPSVLIGVVKSVIRKTSDLEGIFSVVYDAIEASFKWIIGLFGGDPNKFWITKKTAWKRWLEEYNALSVKYTKLETIDVAFAKVWLDCLERGMKLQKTLYGTPPAQMMSKAISDMQAAYGAMKRVISASNNFRQEPILFLVGGDPGIGKTCMMQTTGVNAQLLTDMATYPDAKHQIWTKPEGKYFDSYAGQNVCVIDDIFQAKYVPGSEHNEYLWICKMVSSFGCPLNMAELSQKGVAHFCSKVVIASTNKSSFDNEAKQAINDTGALYRRLGYPLWLELKDGPWKLPNGKLDHPKLVAYRRAHASEPDLLKRHPFHWYTCKKWDFERGVALSGDMEFVDVLREFHAELKERCVQHTQNEADFDEMYSAPFEVQSGLPDISVQQEDDQEAPLEFVAVGNGPVAVDFEIVDRVRKYVWTWLETEMVMPHRETLIKLTIDTENHFGDQWTEEYKGALAWILLHDKRVHSLMQHRHEAMQKSEEDIPNWVKAVSFFFGYFIGSKILKGVLFATLALLKGLFNSIFGHQPQKVVVESADVGEPALHTPAETNRVLNNQIFVRLRSKDTYLELGNFLAVCLTTVVMPAHFIGEMEFFLEKHPEAEVEFTARNRRKIDSCPLQLLLKCPRVLSQTRDLALVDIYQVDAGNWADIKKFILPENSFRTTGLKPLRAVLYTPERDITWFTKNHSRIGVAKLDTGRVVHNLYGYEARTRKGFCGAVVMVEGLKSSTDIVLGIHVAGTSNCDRGVATEVSREHLQELLDDLSKITLNPYVRKQLVTPDDKLAKVVDINCQIGDTFADQHCVVIGGCVDSMAYLSASKYRPSKLAKYFESAYGPQGRRPAIMRPVRRGDAIICPHTKSLMAYITPKPRISLPPNMDSIVRVALKPLFDRSRHFTDRQVWTFEECVSGHGRVKGVNRTKSAGYPLQLQGDEGNFKQAAFGFEGEYVFDTVKAQLVREQFEEMVAEVESGNIPLAIFRDFMKDELRSQKKIDAVATRNISSSPLVYTLVCRRYFGPLLDAIYQISYPSGIAIGINSWSEWGDLYRHIHREWAMDMDYEGFDASQQAYLTNVIIGVFEDFFRGSPDWRQEHEVARLAITAAMTNSVHMAFTNTLYMWLRNLPSGHFLTTIINSVFSLTAKVYAYWRATGKLDFWDHCSVVVYGDDNILTCDNETKELLDPRKLPDHISELGLKVQSADKESELHWKTLDQCTFLKRGFLDIDGTITAPLVLESILYRASWTKKAKADEDQDLVQKLQEMPYELALHQFDVWVKYIPPIVEALKGLDSPPRIAMPWDMMVTKRGYELYQSEAMSRGIDW